LHEQAENNRTAILPTVPPRGTILDRNGVVLASNYSAYTLEITPSKVSDLEATINELSELVDIQTKDRRRFKRLREESKSFDSLPIRNRLTDEEVARSYFIPPPMIGILDHATFSNITEQHKMLYQDTLGPWLSMIQDEVALQLIPDFEPVHPDRFYVEFNIREKLTGSFEERAGVMQQAIGGPWLTINEGRAMDNRPPIDGGDELIRPLNVTQNGDQDPIQAEEQPAVGMTPTGGGKPDPEDDAEQED